ncbi:MAG: carboxymuconolactone decarboxylase family protein [Phycisphaerae bacterium]|nr:carboxymuconolactone decarboxylase family protein [Phycisphaerae bacterium]
MPRLSVVDPASAPAPAKAIFDGPLKGKHFNIFKGMANSPAALEAYLALAGALNKSSLTAAQREVIALTLAEANGCDYCAAAHTHFGTAAGLTKEQTIEARRGRMQDPTLHALAAFTLALKEKQGHVTDADLAAFRAAGFNDGHIAEAVAVYTLNLYTNFFNHVNQTVVDLPAAPALA